MIPRFVLQGRADCCAMSIVLAPMHCLNPVKKCKDALMAQVELHEMSCSCLLQGVMQWLRRTGLIQPGVSAASLKTSGHRNSQTSPVSGQMATSHRKIAPSKMHGLRSDDRRILAIATGMNTIET